LSATVLSNGVAGAILKQFVYVRPEAAEMMVQNGK
jgi:hypothetical protein